MPEYNPPVPLIRYYDDGNVIDAEQVNLIANLIEINFNLIEELNLFGLVSDYCSLSLDMMGNQSSESEFIVTDDFKINFSNPKYNINYWLKLGYYDLKEGDIDDSKSYDSLKEKLVKLNVGDNVISFDEPVVYLQDECTLIIKTKEE